MSFGVPAPHSWTPHRIALTELSDERPSEMKLGIPTLDEMLRFHRGDLVIIGGPAHGGKTLTAMNLILENPELKILWLTPDETHQFVLSKLLMAHLGVTVEEFSQDLHDPNGLEYLQDTAESLLQNVVISDESEPQRIKLLVQEVSANLDGLDIIVFDYVEYLEMPTTDVSAKMVWLKDLARDTKTVMFGIHQSTKGGLDAQVRPNMGLLSGAGHKEAFCIVWCKREYVDHENPVAVKEAHNQPAMEVWTLKNKRGTLIHAPIRCAIERGGKVVEWNDEHTARAQAFEPVPRFGSHS